MTNSTVKTRRRAESPNVDSRTGPSAFRSLLAVSGTPEASAEPSPEGDGAPQPRALGGRPQELDRGALRHLGQRRIGEHEAGEVLDLEALRHGKCPRHDQVAGLRRRDGAAEDLAAPRDEGLHMAGGPMLRLGAIVLGDRPAQDAEGGPARARLL